MNLDELSNELMFVIKKEDLLEFAILLKTVKIKEKTWLNTQELMELLSIKSTTTLQSIRDKGLIEFTQPFKRLILYKRESVLQFLETHSQKPF
jgi:hypothetical protein